jgi:hypothetical protein
MLAHTANVEVPENPIPSIDESDLTPGRWQEHVRHEKRRVEEWAAQHRLDYLKNPVERSGRL